MAEGAVRLGHAVRVLALLDRVAAIAGGVEQLARQAAGHGLLRAAARRRDQPANRQRLGALGAHLDRDLIGRAADPARAYLDAGLHIVERVVKDSERLLLGASLNRLESAVDDPLGDGLLAVEHDVVHELRQHDVAELRVRQDFALLWAAAARHLSDPSSLQLGPEPVRGLLLHVSRRRPGPRIPAFAGALRGLAPARSFRALGAIFGAALAAVLDTLGVEDSAKHVVADSGQVANAAAADQHHRVLLKVVAFAGNVGDHLALVGKAHLGDLAERRIRLLRGGRIDAGADSALLRILLHRRDLGFGLLRFAALADQLVDRRHEALHFLQVTLTRREMRKAAPAADSAPQALLHIAAVFSSKRP